MYFVNCKFVSKQTIMFITFGMIILHNQVCISVTVCNLRGHCHFNVCICRACAIVGVQVYGTQQLSTLCFNY